MQVDVVAALPAGTNAIGKLAANSGVDIGDVTVDNLPSWFTVTAGAPTSPVHLTTEAYLATDSGIAAMVVCKDVLAAPTNVTDTEYTILQVDTQGALYTTHGITGATSSKNIAVGTSIEDLHLSDLACKRVDMMASPDNTGYIWVGGANTAVGVGIRLAPGDFYSVDCDNTDDIQVIATVADEDISYTIFT